MSILERERFASVEYLARKLHASTSSIRRDVESLSRRGLLKRSYGGVELSVEGAAARPLPFSVHSGKNILKKREIARLAACLVNDGAVIFLDASSACYYLAEQLSAKNNITVITNNTDSVSLLSEYKNLRVYSTGGLASHKNRSVLTGSVACDTVSRMHADIFFFSTLSLSSDGMISDDSEEENTVRRSMLRCSDRRVLLTTENRLNSKSAFIFGSVGELDAVVCDAPLDSYFECDTTHLDIISPKSPESR